MIKSLAIGLIVALSINCASLTVNQKLDKVVSSLGILQDAAIGANNQKILSDSSTKLIVTFVISSVKTIKQVPNGWKADVVTGLMELQKALPASDNVKYQVYFDLLNTLIGAA